MTVLRHVGEQRASGPAPLLPFEVIPVGRVLDGSLSNGEGDSFISHVSSQTQQDAAIDQVKLSPGPVVDMIAGSNPLARKLERGPELDTRI
jgi:hypothetical protein